jgi:hypothetical protein
MAKWKPGPQRGQKFKITVFNPIFIIWDKIKKKQIKIIMIY